MINLGQQWQRWQKTEQQIKKKKLSAEKISFNTVGSTFVFLY